MANFRLISALLDCPLSPQLMEQYLNASTIANGTLEKKSPRMLEGKLTCENFVHSYPPNADNINLSGET